MLQVLDQPSTLGHLGKGERYSQNSFEVGKSGAPARPPGGAQGNAFGGKGMGITAAKDQFCLDGFDLWSLYWLCQQGYLPPHMDVKCYNLKNLQS